MNYTRNIYRLIYFPIAIVLIFGIVFLLTMSGCKIYAQSVTVSDQYLKLYQVRYGNRSLGKPIEKVEFTIGGDPWDGVPNFFYVAFKNIGSTGELRFQKEGDICAVDYAIALPKITLLSLFNGRKTIPLWELRRADIEKFHLQMVKENPDWYLYGTDLNYGVKCDQSGYPILDKENRPTPDSPIEFYQQGLTIVQPPAYNEREKYNFFLNYNNPTVREYVIRQTLKLLKFSKDNCLFIDCSGMLSHQIYPSDTQKDYGFIGVGTRDEQADRYAALSCSIYKEIKKRTNNAQIILNGFRDWDYFNLRFFKYLLKPENSDCFDGVMIENRFWMDDYWYEKGKRVSQTPKDIHQDGISKMPWCTHIEFYQEWVERFKNEGKMVLFCASLPPINNENPSNEQLASHILNWYYLIADENTYFYMNDSYVKPMYAFECYNRVLGASKMKARKNDSTWIRQYERYSIEFDTTYGELKKIAIVPKFRNNQ